MLKNSVTRTSAGIYSKLGTNVPYEVPTKCCYILCGSEIQNGGLGLRLAYTFSASFQEQLQAGIYSKIDTKVLFECYYFLCGSKMATLASDWLTYFQLIFSRTAAVIYFKLGTNVPYGVPTKCC